MKSSIAISWPGQRLPGWSKVSIKGATVDRRYLYVPPEEATQVKALGAHWDDRLKCWFILDGQEPTHFARWLGDNDPAEDFAIISDEAFVAAATVACWSCQANIEVICIYCESGIVSGEPLSRFTVQGLRGPDSALAKQLDRWSSFKVDAEGVYANHCAHCGEVQDDLYLHSEPDHPFFDIPSAPPASIRLTQLAGRVQMSGDDSFEI